jgi:hypothetical protein
MSVMGLKEILIYLVEAAVMIITNRVGLVR